MNNQVSHKELKLILNIPNVITAVRVVLSAIIAVLLLQAEFLAAGILLVIAACTDGLEGLIARKLNQSSLGGSLFDLVADELLFMPNLIIAIISGLFSKVNGLMPFNPYPYAIPALAGGVAVLSGVGIYL
jgi:phosphatidylglycerophosphate synthase